MDIPTELATKQSLSLISMLPDTSIPSIDTSIPTLIYNSYNIDHLWRKEENMNSILLLEPSHFKQYPVSDKVINFLVDLSKNINNIKIYVGEIDTICQLYLNEGKQIQNYIISKEHPLFAHYPGIKEERDWMFPKVTGYYPSFYAYWKKCQKYL